MKFGSFGIALLLSAGLHLLLLRSGSALHPSSPALSIDIGEMSVEIVEIANTPPSPSIAPSSKLDVEETKADEVKPREKAAKQQSVNLPLEAIGQWMRGIQEDIERVVERSQVKEKSRATQDGKSATEQRTEAAAPSAASPSRIGVRQEKKGVRAEARIKKGGRPSYPWQAVQRQLEGRVIIEVVVEASGEIQSARVLRTSGHSLLDEAALEFAHDMSLEPAAIDGTPVRSTVQIPISFRLK
jgi:protein TonB